MTHVGRRLAGAGALCSNYPFARPRALLVRGVYLCNAGNGQAGMAALRLARARSLGLHMPCEASLALYHQARADPVAVQQEDLAHAGALLHSLGALHESALVDLQLCRPCA